METVLAVRGRSGAGVSSRSLAPALAVPRVSNRKIKIAGRHGRVDRIEETAEYDGAMPRMARANDSPALRIQRRE